IVTQVLVCILLMATLSAAPPEFRAHTIATDLKGGYQVVAIDVNHDGKIDLIALASGMTELVWFENPTWERHVIAGNLARMINLAALDIDGDGIPEIVLAHEFSMRAKDSAGIVSVLKHNGDPRQPWTVTEIDRLPTSHRLRWADIDGSGKKVVVNAPLIGAKAEAPDYRDRVPLVYYRPGDWKRQVIDDSSEGLVHCITVVDWDRDGRDEILLAGFNGILLYKFGRNEKWSRRELAKGDPAPWPKSGSSDVAVGKAGKESFLATIEPWHGNQVAVYRQKGAGWQREVIDDSLVDGHTIVTVDLDGNGVDEIVAGFRGKPQRVYIYKLEAKGWNRQVLDDGDMSAAACAVADLNGDGRPDIACIGSATHNLKWYENLGTAKSTPR
ncbi:MAG TPA: VCBS repeat-containing protein, partial [Bryobacteraceae bacterium]|nr:VCBS repeat-containing protein [Bryobacteraceae bacterium]